MDLTIKNIHNSFIEAVPEFGNFNEEEIDESYYNFYLGDLGVFISKAILSNKVYGDVSLIFINNLFNENYNDKNFTNAMIVNVLEVLTDYKLTQQKSVEHFNGDCLTVFKSLLNNSFVNLLDNN